jgi:predicted AlkP superfamily phosphohydrolase/phosphomutase
MEVNVSKTRPPVVWMIWDGASNLAVKELLREGALPCLESILKEGVYAPACPPAINCQTPPSLAALFTGTSCGKHGIYGLNIPDKSLGQFATAVYSGFSPAMLKAKTIWEHAGEFGKEYVLVSIPWVLKNNINSIPKGCKFALDGYSKRYSRRGAVLLKDLFLRNSRLSSLNIGPYSFSVELAESGLIVGIEGQSQKLCISQNDDKSEKDYIQISPGVGIYFWLLQRPVDNERLLVYSGTWKTQVSADKGKNSFLSEVGPFNGEGHGSVYRDGIFGPRIVEGGDGSAEDLLVWTIKKASDYFARASLKSIELNPEADLYIFYQPCTDDIGHELIGWCDPASKVYKPELAARIWPFVREVYQMADCHLGRVMKCFGKECSFIISSDHGMAGIGYSVYINEALKQAGLLRYDSGGNIDLEHTVALYHPANNGSVWISGGCMAGKGVTAGEYKNICKKVGGSLKEIRNAGTGEYVIKNVFTFDSNSGMGDMFLVMEDGYELKSDISQTGELIVRSAKSGNHLTNNGCESLKGIFCAKGPGIESNKNMTAIDNSDVAAVDCKQLGIQRL